ncbi:MAG: CheR family methyltransferase, partial [Solirubrobacteraceae bacterium]
MPTADSGTLGNLLEFIKSTRGFDFTGYKRSSIERRVVKRMSEVGVERYEDYIDYLELHAGEFGELFNALLINVTGFFRDPTTWEHLADTIIPQLVDVNGADLPLRIWCAGCASGEEPYTVAMILARAIGDEAFRERVKIYATDVDEEALDQGRLGAYLPRQVEDVPADALERFFERTDQRYVFRKDLRRAVIFGRNDLVKDAPISRVDLLVCRNTLMYFNVEAQSQIVDRFHFALREGGYLFLGKAEMLLSATDRFEVASMRQRIFRRRPGEAADPHHFTPMRLGGEGSGEAYDAGRKRQLRDLVLDTSANPLMAINVDGTVSVINGQARAQFGLTLHDIGRPFRDLEISYRPIELRSLIEQAET